jgi:hypothetical protein
MNGSIDLVIAGRVELLSAGSSAGDTACQPGRPQQTELFARRLQVAHMTPARSRMALQRQAFAPAICTSAEGKCLAPVAMEGMEALAMRSSAANGARRDVGVDA